MTSYHEMAQEFMQKLFLADTFMQLKIKESTFHQGRCSPKHAMTLNGTR